MCLLRKITYGEFSEFIQEKKVHMMYVFETFKEYVLLHFPTYFQNRAICALQFYLESLEMRFFKEL